MEKDCLDKELLKGLARRYEAASFEVNRTMKHLMRSSMLADITTEQFSIMRYLNRMGKSTSSELADSFCVGKSSITAIITRLSDKGLVVREPDDKDRRVTFLRLSPEGERLCNLMESDAYEILSKFIKAMEEEEAIAFIGTFEKLAARLRES